MEAMVRVREKGRAENPGAIERPPHAAPPRDKGTILWQGLRRHEAKARLIKSPGEGHAYRFGTQKKQRESFTLQRNAVN